jgi:hypothetical protein
MKKVLLLAFSITIVLCASAQKEKITYPVSSSKAPTYTFKIINAPDKTFGYDVFTDGRLLIHQNSIPAVAGRKGFKTKAQAERIARLVISKLEAGVMPPSVKVDELKKLKAI